MVYIDPNEVPKPDQRSLMTKILAASNVINDAAHRPKANHIPITFTKKQLEYANDKGWIKDDVLTVPEGMFEDFMNIK